MLRATLLRGVFEVQACICSLEYEDVVGDGLYDPWGTFPELHPFERSHVFPSLADLKAIEYHEGDSREVGHQHVLALHCHQCVSRLLTSWLVPLHPIGFNLLHFCIHEYILSVAPVESTEQVCCAGNCSRS